MYSKRICFIVSAFLTGEAGGLLVFIAGLIYLSMAIMIALESLNPAPASGSNYISMLIMMKCGCKYYKVIIMAYITSECLWWWNVVVSIIKLKLWPLLHQNAYGDEMLLQVS